MPTHKPSSRRQRNSRLNRQVRIIASVRVGGWNPLLITIGKGVKSGHVVSPLAAAKKVILGPRVTSAKTGAYNAGISNRAEARNGLRPSRPTLALLAADPVEGRDRPDNGSPDLAQKHGNLESCVCALPKMLCPQFPLPSSHLARLTAEK